MTVDSKNYYSIFSIILMYNIYNLRGNVKETVWLSDIYIILEMVKILTVDYEKLDL
jgi:hypothetical protein